MTKDNKDRHEAAKKALAKTNRDSKGHFLPGHSLAGPGRKTLYNSRMNEQAFKLALLGMHDKEMASFFGISAETLNSWKYLYPAFSASIQDGKEKADADVAHSLYRRAMGETIRSDKIIKNADGSQEVVTLETELPGDPGAAKHWLAVRQRNQGRWKPTEDDKPAAAQNVNLTINNMDVTVVQQVKNDLKEIFADDAIEGELTQDPKAIN